MVPKKDAWGITPELRKEMLYRERERRFALYRLLGPGVTPEGRHLRSEELLEKRRVFKEACAADPVFFIENCIWTKDPEGKLGVGGDLPLLVFQYARDLWIEPWLEGTMARGKKPRITHDKARRQILTTYRMGYEMWGFRFVPGRMSWVSTDKESKLDGWTDWDSLLGKFRNMWMTAQEAMPWLFPYLAPHSECNRQKLIRFPDWVERGKKIDEEVWGNQLKGVLPNDPRSGAATDGFADEAGWIDELKKLLDGAEAMTKSMTLGSTAPTDTGHLFWKRRELAGVRHNVAPWWLNPTNLEGMHWSEPHHDGDVYPGESRGPWTKQWRSDRYNEEGRNCSSQELARNWDIDPMATAGARVFLSFNRERNCGQAEPKDPTWDLFDPKLETLVGCDPGRGDPWALIWAQIDPEGGWLNIVDYDMSADKTIHYFVPQLLGWPWERKAAWRTAPEALPWHEVVPWSYPRERIERIRRWNARRQLRGGKPKIMKLDFYGTQHYGNDLFSISERASAYGLYCEGTPSQYKVENFRDKANEVLLRTRISGFLVGFRPEGFWPAIDECFQFWRRREHLDTSKAGKPAEPLHDQYSHTCTAFTFLTWDLPMLVPGRVGKNRQVEPHPQASQRTMVQGDKGWW